MPAVRLSRGRRRSSLALSAFTPAKAGIYGIGHRAVTFAPNVTPVTFVEPESTSSASTPEPSSPTSTLFPPSEFPAPAPSRRRVPPGKRRSLGYIPRPPNAFMLFRADFVRQKHVPGSIETNHGSLSKIIGNCWRALPLEEKRVWEVKAKHAKAEHKARYPEYRFRPVHNKNKEKKKEKPTATVEDERRCEEVAQLLLEGKKGDELAAAVRDLDHMREEEFHAPAPFYPPRRPSSVPLPSDYYAHFAPNIALPSVSFLSHSRPTSPMGMSRQQRMIYGQRRASSAQPAFFNRSWTLPAQPSSLQRDHSPLPDVDTSLFEPSFLNGTSSTFSFSNLNSSSQFGLQELMTNLPPHLPLSSPHDICGPLDNVPHPLFSSTSSSSSSARSTEFDPMSGAATVTQGHQWTPIDQPPPLGHSHPSTAYSGSPAQSEGANLPGMLHAPQPQHSNVGTGFTNIWKEFGNPSMDHQQHTSLLHQPLHHQVQHHQPQYDIETDGLGLDFANGAAMYDGHSCAPEQSQHQAQEHNSNMVVNGVNGELADYSNGLEGLFDAQGYADDAAVAARTFEYHDMLIQQ